MPRKNWSLEEDVWRIAKPLLENSDWKKVDLNVKAHNKPPENKKGVYMITAPPPSYIGCNLPIRNVFYIGQGNLLERFRTHAGPRAKPKMRRLRTVHRNLSFYYLVIDNLLKFENFEVREENARPTLLDKVEQALVDTFGPEVNEINVFHRGTINATLSPVGEKL